MKPIEILTTRALNRATLARQMLLQRKKIKPAAAIAQLAGMQAQIPRPPFIGLWSRVEGFRREDLLRAIERVEVVRATMMRATIHLITRDDYEMWRPALQPMLSGAMRSVVKGDPGFDLADVTATGRAFFEEERTFDEFRTHLASRYPEADHRAMAYAVRLHLHLKQVPNDSRWGYPAASQFTVHGDLTGTGRLDDLIFRYLGSFGPASVKDFETWSGLRKMSAEFETLRSKLKTFRDENGKELFDLPKAPRPGEDVEATVRLLPEYDNLVLAYADRCRIVADEHRPRMLSANLAVPATFLVDGVVKGTWTIKKEKVVLEPFGKLAAADRKALLEEGERLVEFVDE